MEGRNEVGEGRGEGDDDEHIALSFKAAVIMSTFTLSGLEGVEVFVEKPDLINVFRMLLADCSYSSRFFRVIFYNF